MLRSHVREEIVRNSGDTSVAGVGQYIQEEKPAAVLAAITRLGQASAGARSGSGACGKVQPFLTLIGPLPRVRMPAR